MSLLTLLGPVAELGKTVLNNRAEKSQAKHEQQLQVIKNGAEWESKMADASASSWKDEWLVILFSIPLILAFIPGMEDVVRNGFEQLNQMPQWYQYSFGVIVAASLSVRSSTKFFGNG